MDRIAIGILATSGLILTTLVAGRQSMAEDAPPAAKSSAAPAPAKIDEPSHDAIGASRFGSNRAAQAAPNEALTVLKSGPDHTRLAYRLKNSPATNVATTIRLLLVQEGEMHSSGGTAAAKPPAPRVAIVSDPVTNSLVISGPPEAVKEVCKLADDLDHPPPMVQIEMEMGEVPAGEAKRGETLKSEGATTAEPARDTFRVLERPANMVVTAHARVVTLDNQPAFVQLGQRVPRAASPLKNPSLNTPRSLVEWANVGLILGVTPRIASGHVVMQVDAEDSKLQGEGGANLTAADKPASDKPAGDSVAGDRATRPMDAVTVQTTVSIPDGKTIILGSAARGKADKELIVLITPHIIKPEDITAEKKQPGK